MKYQEFFDLAKSKGIENVQITEETKKENSVYYINNKLEDYTNCEKTMYTIKAERDGKTEQVYTGYLDESIVELLIEKLDTTETNYKDDYLTNKKNNIIDTKDDVSVENEIPMIKQSAKLKEKYPTIKSIETSYSDVYTKTRIINSKGVDIATTSHNYELYVEASAEKENNISTYSDSQLVSDKRKLSFNEVTNKVLELADIGVIKRKLETKKYNIILSNKVTSSIINKLGAMLSAAEIHQKKSCLENKLNKKVFSDKLNISEEPNNSQYPGYTIFDKEGTKTIDKSIIKNGEIRTYLYDIKESKIDNIKSTGNKYNGIGTRNMYIIPSNKNINELFKEMKNGIYITSYMGSMGTSINCSSGNISMQVFGYIIEDGKIICGFEPAIMTTTIFELLNNIENVGNDLKFTSSSVGAPSLQISNISIAAE